MSDFNPESHRQYLAEIERQFQPRIRDFRKDGGPDPRRTWLGATPVVLAVAVLVLGGLAGGGLL